VGGGIIRFMSKNAAARAQQHTDDDGGVILTPEEEEELERASIEAEEDLRMGRCIPAEEVLAKFRTA
jgi:hypothetical protein